MKKLSLVFVFAIVALFSTTTFAQEVSEDVQETIQQKVEIEVSELPEVVLKTLAEDFSDYTADKAYKATENQKEIFYVLLVKAGEILTVIIDADGSILGRE